MLRTPDPTNEKNDVAVEDMLQHLSLDATISLLHKQIAKKAAEEYKKAELKKREGEFTVSKHRDIQKQKEVDNETRQHGIRDQSSHRTPTAFMSLRSAREAKLEKKRCAVNVQEKVNSSTAQNTQSCDDASSDKYVQLEQRYAELQTEYGTLSKEYMKDMEICKHQNCQLKAALDKAKQVLQQHSLMESTSTISDSSAMVPLLKEAVDQVRVAIATCASRLLALAERHSLTICNLHEYLPISDPHFNSASEMSHLQVALQASFLCELLFRSFESPSFGGDIVNYQSFEKPWRCRQQRLRAFHKLRFLEDGDIFMLQQQDAEFNGFMQTKSKLIESKLGKLVQLENPKKTKKNHADDGCDQHHKCDSNHEQLINEFFAELRINKLYKISILRLAKAVWQLHKLAFAFEPSSAEIFRVSPDSVYDEEYMQEEEESMMQAKEWDKMGQYLSEKHVLFMSLPGFTVGNSIIKSLVSLNHS